MLNPFREVVDPYDIHQGNPDLNPEYIDAYELSYLRYFKGAIITSSLFFRQTHGLISRYRTMIDSLTSLTEPVNLSKANSYGFELIANLNTPQWLNLNGSFTYYKTEIQGNNIEAELSNSGYTWTTKLLATVKMWLGFDLSMIYNYNSKRPIVDGFIEPMQNFDVSLKKTFFNKKFDISMRVSDVLNSQRFQINLANTGYKQNFTNKRESRVAYLTLTYRFGNLMENQHKNGQRKKENEDTNPPDIEF
jgi:outer membrane receptor protein involved in Fe transport